VGACTSLLGDFSVGDGGAGDTGSDVIPNDGGPDGNPQDGGDGAPPPLESCAEAANARRQLTKGLSLNAIGVHEAMLPNAQARVVLANYVQTDASGTNAEVRSYTFDPKNPGNNPDIQTQVTNGAYQILSITRYAAAPFGGFAALWEEYDQTFNTYYLWASRIQDDQTTWTTPHQLSKVGSNNNVTATFTVLDPKNDSYYVVFSSSGNGQQMILAGTTSGSADQLTTVGTFTVQSGQNTAYDLLTPSIAIGATQQPFVLLSTSTSGPPPPGLAELLLVPGKQNVTITPPSNLNYVPLAMANSIDPLNANVAILEADLSNEVATYHVGKMPFTSMGSFDPKTVPASSIPPAPTDAGFSKLANITFGNAPHWELTPAGEQGLIVAPTEDPLLQKLYGGLNFGWWDGKTGAMRAYQGGANHLFGDVPFPIDADSTFVSLTGNLAQIEIAFLALGGAPQQNNPPPPSDLWVTQIGCQ
jgi:hypothetical protein